MIPPCPQCGNPWQGSDESLCPACRLQSALPTAGEIYAEFATRFAGSPPSRFEALCLKHPQHAVELRLLHDLATSAGRHHPASPPSISNTPRALAGGPLETLAESWTSGSRYRVEGVIEQVGLGVCYAVRDRELDRVVAMKVIGMGRADHPVLSIEELPPAWVEHFLEEARILAQIAHPGIPPIHELGLDPRGRLYFTTPLRQGLSFREVLGRLRHQPDEWNFSRVLRAFLQGCEAVAHAHEHGVLHRALNPDTLLVGNLGEVQVVDWGLARFLRRKDLHDLSPHPASASVPYDAHRPAPSSEATEIHLDPSSNPPIVTRDGTVLGTPAYMPPEQAEGGTETLGPYSDVYSLGAILYELLAGHAPYLDANPTPSPKQVLDALRTGPPRPILLRAGDPLHGLATLCNLAMERHPPARHADAGEFARDLRHWLDDRLLPPHPVGNLARIKAWILH